MSLSLAVAISVYIAAAFAAAIGTGEQPGPASQGNAAQRAFGGVVAEGDAAVVEEAGEGRFACRSCEKITQPLAPFHVIPRGHVGSSLLPMILYAKYGEHQPLNRQSEAYAREGVDLEGDHRFWRMFAKVQALARMPQ